jgi:hypothetical protein
LATTLLPTSHTCTNTLVLPPYATPEALAQKLMFAILETQTFELV